MDLLFAIKTRIKYLLHARYCQGHRVHSPHTFDLITNTIYAQYPYYSFTAIEKIRRELLSNRKKISLKGRTTTVSKELKRSSKSPKYAQLLQRLAANNDAKTIVELGTNMGISTLYLASNNTKARVITYEREKALTAIAKENINKIGLQNIEIIEGDIDTTLPSTINRIDDIDLLFIDANHTYEATKRYYETFKSHKSDKAIFVIDDIHWSPDMEKIWKEIISEKEVRLSIDLFSMGIVIFNNELKKQHYIVNYL